MLCVHQLSNIGLIYECRLTIFDFRSIDTACIGLSSEIYNQPAARQDGVLCS